MQFTWKWTEAPFFKKKLLYDCSCHFNYCIDGSYNKSANTELDDAALENYLSYQTNLNQYDLITALDLRILTI
jgi:hypothetical protein